MLDVNKIYCGDNLPIMHQIGTASVDAVLTDPPYNIKKNYNQYADNMADKEFWDVITKTYEQIYRVLKDTCHLTFTCAQKQIWVYRPMLEKIGFTFRHLGMWHNPARKAGSYPGMWPFAWEAIMDFTKGKKYKKLNNSNCVGFTDVFIEKPPSKKEVDHPAARPVQTWKSLVELISTKHDIVLDPWGGSGTTALVCKSTGRNFILMELDELYVKSANQRITEMLPMDGLV